MEVIKMKVEHANKSVANITMAVIANKAFVASPRVLFNGTDAEESAESMVKNLYDDKGKLDISIATELVTLGQMQDCGNDQVAFSSLYGFLKPEDKLRFDEVVEGVLKTGKETLQQSVEYNKENPENNGQPKVTQQPKAQEKKGEEKPAKQPVKVTNSPTEQEFKEKFPEEYKVVSEAAQAANSIGFNINNFLKPNQQPVAQQVPVGQQSSMIPQQPIPVQQPASVQPQQNTLPPKADPMPGASLQDRVAEMKKHYKLIDGTHPGMTADNINSLLFLLQNTQLKADMKKYDAKSRPNNMFMQEIEIPDEFKGKFDFCFKMTTKNPKKYIRVLLNSNQEFIAGANSWANATQFDIIEQEKKGGK